MDEMLASNLNSIDRKLGLAVAPADRFEILFITHYPRVVAIARRIVGEGHLAEDVAQDVFASFYNRSHPLNADRAAGWLYTAAAHTALNVVRGNRRRARREVVDAGAGASLDNAAVHEFDPEHQLEARELRDQVRTALRSLSTKHSTILALRYGGLTYAEVAAALDIGINQVGTLLARAEAAFKREITRVASR
jgi:RNA polymerase sigma factor (sigma-70 family)